MHIRRLRRIGIWVLIFLLAWSGLAWVAAKALIVESELPQADALVVLSGSSNYRERTRAAAELFMAGRAPKIILTNDNEQGGWSSAEQRNPLFEELEFAELVRAGVPAEKIERLTQTVTSTYDEAVLVREYASTQGLRSIIVVTSPYHSRRALWTWRRVFQESGIEIGLSAAPTGEQSPSPFSWWWHPRGWSMVAGEYPKLIYYWLHYR
ncbi:MAG TPA: YdcF family protein [Pyrinomonadaceae bacterium]|nr:YdcF family protein [Pyrinomonadaceae bacterium]